jgi:AcrR family transcriptional regulator
VADESLRGYAKGRAKREGILDAATVLFGEVGYRAASLREIAARAGLSHPGLLHHFPTKESLLAAVLDRRDRLDHAQFELDTSQGVDALRHLVDVVAHNAELPGLVELYCVLSAEATAPDHPAHAFFVDRYARVVALCVEAFRVAEAEGALRPGIDPVTAGRSLVALMDGLQLQWLLDRDSVDMAAAVREHLDDRLAVRV